VRLRSLNILSIWAICLFFILSCSPQPPGEPLRPSALELVPAREVPRFEDDLDPVSLRAAIKKSLIFYDRVPADRTYALGEMQLNAGQHKATLIHFLKLLDEGRLNSASIASDFDVYRTRGDRDSGKSLVTGYYEPVLEGSLERDSSFPCPLYRVPPDLVNIDLSTFDPDRFSGVRLVGRLKDSRFIPYYTRAEIEVQRSLEASGSQLVWLRDPVDVFFLHIQGSGMITLRDGSVMRVGYAGTNGRAYRSIGKYLIDKGVMNSSDVTLQAIKTFLKGNPEIREEVLSHNESYIFFRKVEDGPVGSINVVLTAGRSIATDPQHHPRGALAFLEAEKPRMNDSGEVVAWEPLHRWVLNQDAGGAIKGVGRVDLFCGSGEAAERVAGRMKHPGRLYFLVKKE
jgi:membrane-bound lytic murein transglycosylase A